FAKSSPMVVRSRQFPLRFGNRLICVAAFGAIALGASRARSAPASPIAKGPYLQDLEPTSVVVRAEVSPPAAATLEVREAGSGNSSLAKPLVFEDRAAESFHSIRATGLRPKTNYNYVFRSGGVSQIGKFTTAPDPSSFGDSKDSFSFLVYGDNRT